MLSGKDIERCMKKTLLDKLLVRPPRIVITPYDPCCLGSNSYDLHLDPTLKVYKATIPTGMKPAIDYKKYLETPEKLRMWLWFESANYYENYINHPENYDPINPNFHLNPFEHQETIEIQIPNTGLMLSQRFGYIGSTVEYTETHGKLFPYIDGKSSIGRNFMLIHQTAGRGDSGFCGNWTLEITITSNIVVYPGMRIGQIYYDKTSRTPTQYNEIPTSHYHNQSGPTPASPIIVDPFIRDYLAQQGAQRGK